MPPPARPTPASVSAALPALAALFLAALAMRPQIIGVGPLLPAIREDLGISHGVAGLLGAIPVLCMGIFAPIGPRVARALGPRRAIAACIVTMVVFGLLRAVVPGAPLVLAVTFGIGLGVGTIGPILTMVVRLRLPARPVLATGAYAGGIVLGSTVAAAVAVPLAAAGGWRWTFAVFALVGLASLVAWLVLLGPDRREEARKGTTGAMPWRSATAWSVALVFGLQSVLYYGLVAWLPNVYLERGWPEADAAGLLAIMHIAGLSTTLGVPLFADRIGTRRIQLLLSAAVLLAGLLGIVLVPEPAVGWAVLLGLGAGAIFPLALTLPVDVADGPREVGATAALMLLVGYALSSLGPVALGLARDLTGDFGASLWLLVVLSAVLVAACWLMSPGRLDRGVGRVAPAAPSP